MIGFYGQVLKFVGFKTSLHFNRDSSHYLTIEKTGSDHNSNGKIEQDLGEKNNDYNESYDQIGKRFKLSSDFTMAWMFTTIIMF